MLKLNLGFGRYSDPGLLVKAQAIHTAMTGNASFPTPSPTLADLQTAIDAYSAALSAAQEGGKTNVVNKNTKKRELGDLLVNLGNYVTFTANGDDVVLTSSGFSTTKQREPLPPLVKPEIIKVENGGNSGELTVNISAVKGARTYVYQYTKDPLNGANEWTGQNSTLTRFQFNQLQSGQKYWCRVVAYGINEQMVYSDPVARIVQ